MPGLLFLRACVRLQTSATSLLFSIQAVKMSPIDRSWLLDRRLLGLTLVQVLYESSRFFRQELQVGNPGTILCGTFSIAFLSASSVLRREMSRKSTKGPLSSALCPTKTATANPRI